MKMFERWKIATRLRAGLGVLVVMLMMVSSLGISRMAENQHRVTEITEVNNLKSRLATTMRDSVYEGMVHLRNVALVGSLSAIQEELAQLNEQHRRYVQVQGKLASTFSGHSADAVRERALLQEIRQAQTAAGPLIARVATMAAANQGDQVYQVLVNELLPVQARWMRGLDALIRYEEALSDKAAKDGQQSYESARLLMLLMGSFSVVLAVIVSMLLSRSMLRQLGGELGYAVDIAERIAAGQLEGRIATREGDTRSLLAAMKKMRDSLAGIVSEVREKSETIAAATSEIAFGNLNLSSRTEQQASSSQQTATLLVQLTTTVQRNAKNADMAHAMAKTAAAAAGNGGEVVGQVVKIMDTINQSANRIVDIVGVIDGIAFQTNILALNAAVEAARAGDQGRGFAVVASEVRALAQRSAGAAKEIKHLINNSVQEVGMGLQLAGKAGGAMNEIVSGIRQVTELMAEIASASQKQSADIGQVGTAMAHIDDATQQNAALVEQAAAAAENLKVHAAELARLVSVFKLSRGPEGGVPHPALQLRQPLDEQPALMCET
ncbi:methyl-accepting chemotaxis protein [Janthinobacterium sp. HLX7-2]|uniref:methyl-accepting chemotaxis protein n=1 Tax=Janthinobacterium sp. HLX7-2 TaxID=1259331 RepID=UPI003F1EF466